jgi:hypothetical protein
MTKWYIMFLRLRKDFVHVAWNELWERKAEENLVIAIHSF